MYYVYGPTSFADVPFCAAHLLDERGKASQHEEVLSAATQNECAVPIATFRV